MLKKEQECELSKCKAKQKEQKVNGEFFEFRFHGIILGLDLKVLNFWFFFFKKKEQKVVN